MDDVELYWLAGLLEGEGAFLAGPPSSPNRPAICLQMTDRDIVERVGTMLGRAVCRSDRGLARGHKSVFMTTIKGNPAVEVMLALRPALGRRRQVQIDRAIVNRPAGPARWFKPMSRCGNLTCDSAAAVRGLCKKHYKLWWKARKRGTMPRSVTRDAPAMLTAAIEPLMTVPTGDPRSIAWLAGLLEGEGYFGSIRTAGASGGYPMVKLQMTDEDVVRAAARFIGAPSVWRIEPRRSGWSPTFNCGVSGVAAVTLMRNVRPHMGERRRQVIDSAIEVHRPIRLVKPPAMCSVPSCEEPHDSRGLCHKHYMTWLRDRARGRPERITALR